MKKVILLNALLLAAGAVAQVKVWTGGGIGMGYLGSAPTSGYKVQISGNTLFTSATGSTSFSAAMIRGNNGNSTASTPEYTWNADNTSGIFHVGVGNYGFSTSGTERFRINGGTLTTYGNFNFASSTSAITSCAFIRGTNTWGAAGTPEYSWNGDGDCGMFHPGADILGFSTNASERMRLTNNGLLIGTTSDPGNVRLFVAAATGNQAIYSSTSFSTDWNYHQINNVNRGNTKGFVVQLNGTDQFQVFGNGNVWCAGTYSSSDKTLKENIDTLTGALNKVLQLQGVTYNFKSSVTGVANPKKEIGLIAQDVEAVLPEAVATNDKGLKGIAYQHMVALLIEAIKEQDKKITKLQNDLAVCCTSGQRNMENKGETGNMAERNPDTQLVEAKLWQNNPNPFGQSSVIKCFIPQKSKAATLLIFDMNGTLKKTITLNERGEGLVIIHAREFIAGMYLYSLIVDGQEVDTKKMILTE
jgi:hypothetical protein